MTSQRLPLTYSQLAHWQSYRLPQRPSLRHLAFALRLAGALDIQALHASLLELLVRHEALRMQLIVIDERALQTVGDACLPALEAIDLTDIASAQRETELQRLLGEFILQPIDVTRDPLFATRLFRLDADQHALILATDHLISDAASLGLLQRDLIAIYRRRVTGAAVTLPAIDVRFSEHAQSQARTHDAWVAKHGTYWEARMRGGQRLRFPCARTSEGAVAQRWETVLVTVDRESKQSLSTWSRANRTTLVMTVFTAYVALVLRWCDVGDAIVRQVVGGRASRQVQNTVGFFASTLHLRIEATAEDGCVELLRRVTEEYCNACAHADHCYLESCRPRPSFTRNPLFNWIPRHTDRSGENAVAALPLSFLPLPFDNPALSTVELDHEPIVECRDREDAIDIAIHFPQPRFEAAHMLRFGRSLIGFLQTLANRPQACLRDLPLH